jgi:peptidoglycan/LPS O-acetylase OafA/YrhL
MAKDYRADIDGLRAVAVGLVVAFHAFPALVPAGFVGVDVFFVISGYLITGFILDRQKSGTFSITEFYIRRARRILPALALVIAVTLAIGFFALLPASYTRLGLHAVAGAFFFPNLVYWGEAGYFDVAAITKPLLHLWSLGVEEQFYLVWPLLLMWFWRRKERLTAGLCVVTAISLAYSSIAAFYEPTAAFYSPLSRLWELGVGGILASRRIKVPYPEFTSCIGLILIFGAALRLTDRSPFPGLLAMIPVAGAGMIIASGSLLLRQRPLVALGLISYSLYLWHWPLLSFAGMLAIDTDEVKVAIVVALSVFLAWLTTRFVEYPIRFGALRSHGVAISAGAIFAVSLGGATIFYSSGLAARYPLDIRPVLATMDYEFRDQARVGRCWITQKAEYKDYKPECRNGDIVVWGDSYSGLLGTGLPMPYAQFSRDGCPPLLTDGADPCSVGNAAVLDEIIRIKPKRAILFGAWRFRSINWQSDAPPVDPLRRTLQQLHSGVEDIIVLGPSPDWPPTLPDIVFKYWTDFGALPDRIERSADGYHAVDAAFRKVADSEHVRFVSIFDALCNSDGCLTHTPASRSELLFWDHGHLTVEGATYIVQKLGLAHLDHAQVQ